jgi:hypothetical protein
MILTIYYLIFVGLNRIYELIIYMTILKRQQGYVASICCVSHGM